MSIVVPSDGPKHAVVVEPTRGKLAAIYHYATPLDMALVGVGCVCRGGVGFLQTYVLIIFGEFFVIDGGRSYLEMGEFMLWAMCLFGVAILGCEGIGMTCLELSKNRQVAKWRKSYIKVRRALTRTLDAWIGAIQAFCHSR